MDNINQNPSFIILTAGVGRRMKLYGPKSLIKIGGYSILDRMVEGIDSFYHNPPIKLVAGFKYEKIARLFRKHDRFRGIELIKNDKYEICNSGASLSLGIDDSASLICMHGDLVLPKSIFSEFPTCSFISIPRGGLKTSEIGVNTDGEYAASLSYGAKLKWGQVVGFAGKELRLLKQIDNIEDKSIYEIINIIIENGGKFRCVRHAADFYEIDMCRDIQRVTDLIENKKEFKLERVYS